jgi:hypothetical protein
MLALAESLEDNVDAEHNRREPVSQASGGAGSTAAHTLPLEPTISSANAESLVRGSARASTTINLRRYARQPIVAAGRCCVSLMSQAIDP